MGSRLTISFVLILIIAGGILTYSSVSIISNLKELTEKRIFEEERELSQNVVDAIRQELEILVTEVSSVIDTSVTLNRELISLIHTNNLLNNVFVMHRNGEFIYPHYITQLQTGFSRRSPISFSTFFNNGEQAEFNLGSNAKARSNYLKALAIARSKPDSAKALNALGRISVKLAQFENASTYYSRIISDFYSELDQSGYPYANYAIAQLVHITTCDYFSIVRPSVESYLAKTASGQIPLVRGTENLLDGISKKIKELELEKEFDLSIINSGITGVISQINLVRELEEALPRLIEQKNNNKYEKIAAGFKITFSLEVEQGVVLINNEFDTLTGLLVDSDSLLKSVHLDKLQGDLNFKYHIKFQDDPGSDSVQEGMSFTSLLDPFFENKWIHIELADRTILNDFVRQKGWIYGISLVLLIAGMALGLILISRDISRERRLAQVRSDFVSNVTHELKTPLTAIKMFAESLFLDRVRTQEERKEYLAVILKESDRLKGMINNILEFSRSGKDKTQYRFLRTNLSDIILAVIKDHDYWLEEKQFELKTDLDTDLWAMADSEKMKQVFSNLLTNAIKYSSDSKKINIVLKEYAEMIRISFTDQGIGIPKDQIPRIFDKFYRVNEMNTNGISGTGLGLTVVKEIVEAHDGEIHVVSQLGKGTSFTIVLKAT